MPEYEAWKESLGRDTNSWNIKYYKVCSLVQLFSKGGDCSFPMKTSNYRWKFEI
jgi:hypothetical protein